MTITDPAPGLPGTTVRSVFPGTLHLLAASSARPGTVCIDTADGDESIDAVIRIAGIQILAYVLRPDPYNEQRRIVVRDLLGDDPVQVDTFVSRDLSVRQAVAVAEGMVRGLALTVGVDLVTG